MESVPAEYVFSFQKLSSDQSNKIPFYAIAISFISPCSSVFQFNLMCVLERQTVFQVDIKTVFGSK